MTLDVPYFMNNIEWYEYNDQLTKYILTDKAPPEAIKSYEEFYNQLEGNNQEQS